MSDEYYTYSDDDYASPDYSKYEADTSFWDDLWKGSAGDYANSFQGDNTFDTGGADFLDLAEQLAQQGFIPTDNFGIPDLGALFSGSSVADYLANGDQSVFDEVSSSKMPTNLADGTYVPEELQGATSVGNGAFVAENGKLYDANQVQDALLGVFKEAEKSDYSNPSYLKLAGDTPTGGIGDATPLPREAAAVEGVKEVSPEALAQVGGIKLGGNFDMKGNLIDYSPSVNGGRGEGLYLPKYSSGVDGSYMVVNPDGSVRGTTNQERVDTGQGLIMPGSYEWQSGKGDEPGSMVWRDITDERGVTPFWKDYAADNGFSTTEEPYDRGLITEAARNVLKVASAPGGGLNKAPSLSPSYQKNYGVNGSGEKKSGGLGSLSDILKLGTKLVGGGAQVAQILGGKGGSGVAGNRDRGADGMRISRAAGSGRKNKATGGLLQMARGGRMSGGQDDVVPINAAPGEYVFDADVVAALGDGNTQAGAAKLDQMRQNIRKHKRSAGAKSIPPKSKDIASYLKGAR